jgi:hypothetical protein
MAQGIRGSQGPQKCFLLVPDSGVDSHNQVARRQTAVAPANTRLQLVRGQSAQTLPSAMPLRSALIKPTTAERPRLKHASVAPVPTEHVQQRKTVEIFDQIWPAWRLPIGIRSSYTPEATRLWGALLAGEVVGGPSSIYGPVLSTSAWQTQKGDKTGCFRTCLRMIRKENGDAPPSAGISMVVEKNKQLIKTIHYQQGIDVINSYLHSGSPIIVGVNIKWGSPGNADKTTDHFVVIVARGKDKTGHYYRFFDPGAWNMAAGTSPNNKLYYEVDTKFYKGESQYNLNHDSHKPYTLTWVRKLK